MSSEELAKKLSFRLAEKLEKSDLAILKLDERGEPRLVGLNVSRIPPRTIRDDNYFGGSVGIHAETIKKFLEKNDLLSNSD